VARGTCQFAKTNTPDFYLGFMAGMTSLSLILEKGLAPDPLLDLLVRPLRAEIALWATSAALVYEKAVGRE
jgi:hypothetical protein